MSSSALSRHAALDLEEPRSLDLEQPVGGVDEVLFLHGGAAILAYSFDYDSAIGESWHSGLLGGVAGTGGVGLLSWREALSQTL